MAAVIAGQVPGAYSVMQDRTALGTGKPGLREFTRMLLTNGQTVFSHLLIVASLAELIAGPALTRGYWWWR